MKHINAHPKEEKIDEINMSKALTSFMNNLSRIMLSENNSIVFEKLEYRDSFPLVKEIISSFKEICRAPGNNKKLLLLELFTSYFMNEESFKAFEKEDIVSFENIIESYYGKFSLPLQMEKFKLSIKKEPAKQFLDFLIKIEDMEDYFSNIGIKLLEKNGYNENNLLRYLMNILSYKKAFFYDLKEIEQEIGNLSYKELIDKLNAFSGKFNQIKNKENIRLKYKNDFYFIPTDTNAIAEMFANIKVCSFPNHLRKKIKLYISQKKNQSLDKKNEKNESKKKAEEAKETNEEKVKNEESKIIIKTELNEKVKEKYDKCPLDNIKIPIPEKKFIGSNNEQNNATLIKKIMNMEKELKKTQTELDNTKLTLKKTQTELDNTNEELEQTKLKLQKAQLKIEKGIEEIKENNIWKKATENKLKLIGQNLKKYEDERKNLKEENKKIESTLELIRKRDIYKAIIDSLNRFLALKSIDKYEERINIIQNNILNYINKNKNSDVSNLCQL